VKSGFLEKLVARLDRVEPGEVQQIVTRLIREKGFLEKVFEALQEGVIILDPNGVIGFVNRAASRFFGLDPQRAEGEHLSSQVRGLDWKILGKPGRTISRDLEVFYPENRFLNFYLAPIEGGSITGESLGYVMLVRDLTRTREEAAKILESERVNALTLLAAGVAHEIGNPLNSLDIHLQLLGRKFRWKRTSPPPAARSGASIPSSNNSCMRSGRRCPAASARTSTRCCTNHCVC